MSMEKTSSTGFARLACSVLLVTCLLVATTAAVGAAPVPARTADMAEAQAVLGRYLVVENAGQFAPEVRFTLAQGEQRIWVTQDALWLDAPDPAAPRRPGGLTAELAGRRAPRERSQGGTALRFSFAGANPAAALEPFGRLGAHVSYFWGSDPAQWHADVPAWAGVRYRDLYPGIDLVVGGDADGAVPWRLEARAGADLGAVRLQVEGADVASADLGELRFMLAGREVAVNAPAWSVDGEPAVLPSALAGPEANVFALSPQAVEGVVPAAEAAASEAAAPEAAADLVYSRLLGGAPAGEGEGGEGIAVDSLGNAYFSGTTSNASFPGVAGHYDASYNGARDVFVAKVDQTAATILYATYIGGTGEDRGAGIAVAGGLAYVTGETSSTDFPGAAGTAKGKEAFVVALAANGNSLRYSWVAGGSSDDRGVGVAVQGSDTYMVGTAGSTDLPGTGCGAIAPPDFPSEVLVARLDAAGKPVYVGCYGGSNDDLGYGIAVANQVAYVTGASWSTDFGWPAPTPAGDSDIFVASIGGDGALQKVTMIGGTLGDQGNSIAASVNTVGSGNLYVAGSTISNDFALAAARPAGRVDSDAVVVRIPVPSFAANFATYLGGTGDDLGRGIAVDTVQALYVSGATTSTELSFPVTAGAYDTLSDGSSEGFVVRMDLSIAGSNKVTYGTFLGQAGEDAAARVATDSGGNAFITGSTNGQGFPTTVGAAATGDDQVFVAKLKVSAPPLAPVVTISASAPDVVLTWGPVSGAGRYQALRSPVPYFVAGDWSSTLLPAPTTSPYHDVNALTQAGAYFYVVKAVSAAPEQAGPSSNQVGKFSFSLVKGN